MSERKLFFQDKEGLLHEIKSEDGFVKYTDINAAIKKYYGEDGGVPVKCIKYLEVSDPIEQYTETE